MKTVECNGDSERCVDFFEVHADRPGPYFCTPDCRAYWLLEQRSAACAEAIEAEMSRKRLIDGCVAEEEERFGKLD